MHILPNISKIKGNQAFVLLPLMLICEILSNKCIVFFCLPDRDVINFEIILNNHLFNQVVFSTCLKSQDKNFNILRTKRAFKIKELLKCFFASLESDFNKILDVLPAFTCARTSGNLWSICLGVNIFSPSPWIVLYLASDTMND